MNLLDSPPPKAKSPPRGRSANTSVDVKLSKDSSTQTKPTATKIVRRVNSNVTRGGNRLSRETSGPSTSTDVSPRQLATRKGKGKMSQRSSGQGAKVIHKKPAIVRSQKRTPEASPVQKKKASVGTKGIAVDLSHRPSPKPVGGDCLDEAGSGIPSAENKPSVAIVTPSYLTSNSLMEQPHDPHLECVGTLSAPENVRSDCAIPASSKVGVMEMSPEVIFAGEEEGVTPELQAVMGSPSSGGEEIVTVLDLPLLLRPQSETRLSDPSYSTATKDPVGEAGLSVPSNSAATKGPVGETRLSVPSNSAATKGPVVETWPSSISSDPAQVGVQSETRLCVAPAGAQSETKLNIPTSTMGPVGAEPSELGLSLPAIPTATRASPPSTPSTAETPDKWTRYCSIAS